MSEPDTTPLLLQMGDSKVSGFSSNGSGVESSSWRADTIDWGYGSDQTDPEMIFHRPMDSDIEMSLMGQENMELIDDAQSIVGDLPMDETPGTTIDDEIDFEGKLSSGSIWWNSSWAQNQNLYYDHDYWRCDEDGIMENENPEEENSEKEDPEEENSEEEDPEEKDPKGEILEKTKKKLH